MISKEQFDIIENNVNEIIKNNEHISIFHTEYVKMDPEEREAFPDLDDNYGVICFMSEDDEENFIMHIYKEIAKFANQYGMCLVKIETRYHDDTGYADVCFLDLL